MAWSHADESSEMPEEATIMELITITKVAPATPKVGDGASLIFWSDRHACTVIAVSPSGKKITVQQDKATRVDGNGMSDMQSYSFECDPNGAIYQFSLRKNGEWCMVGDSSRGGGVVCSVTGRYEYYDFSF